MTSTELQKLRAILLELVNEFSDIELRYDLPWVQKPVDETVKQLTDTFYDERCFHH